MGYILSVSGAYASSLNKSTHTHTHTCTLTQAGVMPIHPRLQLEASRKRGESSKATDTPATEAGPCSEDMEQRDHQL